MTQIKNRGRYYVLSVLMALGLSSNAQFISKVIDYLPAPGQYTNADFIGTPDAAKSIAGTNKGMVSLGAFGGYVTVYFSQAIQNDPANPYGVDFTIYGNATSTWSEPGIIQVMKDENKNGIPDETWYEIAGSDHFWNITISGYEVTYKNSGLNKASNIEWTDNSGATGIIPENSFHQQPYYPKPDLFPIVPTNSYALSGTRLSGQIDLSIPGQVNSFRRSFGYADNTPVLSLTEKLPDNPYTLAIEGSGGDAIDIGWAVDQDKKPVFLDEINFIRIYTGMNALVGWLGEISTEITGIRDVEPAVVSGIRSAVIIQDLPLKIKVGESLTLNAVAFENGLRNADATFVWTVSDPESAEIVNGLLNSKKTGKLKIRATLDSNPEIFAEKDIEFFSVGKAEITLQITSLKVNDRLELSGKLTDQNGEILTGINSVWSVGNEQIANVVALDGKYYVQGKNIGKTWLFLEASGETSIRDSVEIEVLPESVLKKVFVAVKTSERTLVPRHSVWVGQSDLTSKVDRARKSYGLLDVPFVSLAHVVASAFEGTEASNEWAFRDDAEGNSQLYLWKVPEIEDGSTIYTFGYGGSRSSNAYRKTWVVMLNQQSYVSGFDTVKVNNGDDILIYHIVDNDLPWEVSHLTLSSDTIKINQQVEIQEIKYSCLMSTDRLISINSSESVVGQQAQLFQANQVDPELSSTTDEFGKATFLPGKTGNYLIRSGIDEAFLTVETTTGSHLLSHDLLKCSVFPNPFRDFIQIGSESRIDEVELYTIQGQRLFTLKNPSTEIDVKSIQSGIYLLKVKSGTKVSVLKTVKN